MKKKIKNLTIEYGKVEAWGLGAAVVFTEGLVLAIGLWYVEINW